MKKIISIVLLLTLCLSLFAGCNNEKEPEVTYDLASAKAYLTNMYQTAGKGEVMTLVADKDVLSKVTIDGVVYDVEWTVKVTSGAAEDVKVGESTKANQVKLDINEMPEAELWFTATATVKAGDGTTETVSFNYKVAASDRPATPTSVSDGTYVILYDNLTFSALAEDKTYGYAYATEVTVTDGVVSGHTAADIITIKNVDDGFTMQDVYGRYIYLKGTYNSFNVGTELSDDACAVWQLLTDKDGKQFIVNKSNMKTLAYDTSYTSWGAYPEITDTRMSNVTVIAATAPEGGDTPGTDTPGTDTPGTSDKPVTKPSSLADQIKAAQALAEGEKLPYTSTMTGKITKINEEYSEEYKNITVTIEYSGKSYKVYRVKGDGAADLAVGDTITVTGNLQNWYGDVQIASGNLDKVVKGEKAPTSQTAIVDAAYALDQNASLDYEATLTGKIVKLKTPYDSDFKNMTVTIAVDGREDKPIECYRMKGDSVSNNLCVGDTITVTGMLKNYNGTVEFDAGCIMSKVVSGGAKKPATSKEIVDAAFALAGGDSLPYFATLTGKVVEITDEYSSQYKNISVIIEVEGSNGVQQLKCFRMKGDGADALAVGDTVTVTGVIKNYVHSSGDSEIEFDAGCTFVKA